MKRNKKEITGKELIESVLRKALVCRIGMSKDDVPYVVPMGFGYCDNIIYLHSAKEGKKIDILRHNNTVCFEVDIDNKLEMAKESCVWSMRYKSVIGWGKTSFVEDKREKITALECIMNHYAPEKQYSFSEKMIDKVVIIKIIIEEMTGKQS
ncbi:MAG: pyridoxamine 5'-phosphate oxidase family protein [Candidatus Methanofastidiosia archaeon]